MITPTNMATTPQPMEATMNHLVMRSSNSMVTFCAVFVSLLIGLFLLFVMIVFRFRNFVRWRAKLIIPKRYQGILISTRLTIFPHAEKQQQKQSSEEHAE